MRHLIVSVASLEAEKLEQAERERLEAIMATPMLSMEEQAIEVAEQTQIAHQINSDLSEAGRVLELSDSMEDLASIVEGIEAADKNHTALIETVGQAAVAGTDVSPEEIVPAMESFVGGKVAAEGFRETAYAIWQKIQEFVKRIWTKIEEFFYRIFGDIPRMRRAIAQMEEAINKLGTAVPEEKKLSISSGSSNLQVNHKGLKNGAELRSAMGELVDYSKYVYEKASHSTVERGKSIAAAITSFEPAKAAEAVAALRGAMAKSVYPTMKGEKVNETRFPGFKAYIGAPLMGNVSLCYTHYQEKKEGGSGTQSDIALLERFSRSVMELIPTAEKAPTESTNVIEMDVLSIADMKDLLKDAQSILDAMEKFKRGGGNEAISKERGEIAKASSAAEKKYAQYGASSNADERAATAQYRSLLNFNATYAKWAAQPYVPFTAHALKSIRSVMVVVQKSMAVYKEPSEVKQTKEEKK
jgi:hypothetical protein